MDDPDVPLLEIARERGQCLWRAHHLADGFGAACRGQMPGRGRMLEGDALGPQEIGELAAIVVQDDRSEEHTSELQSLMRISYAVFCLKKKKNRQKKQMKDMNNKHRINVPTTVYTK